MKTRVMWAVSLMCMSGSLTTHALELCDGDQVNKAALDQTKALMFFEKTLAALSETEQALNDLSRRAHKIELKLDQNIHVGASAWKWMSQIRGRIKRYQKPISQWKRGTQREIQKYQEIESCVKGAQFVKLVVQIQHMIAKEILRGLDIVRAVDMETIEYGLSRFDPKETSTVHPDERSGPKFLVANVYIYTMYEIFIGLNYKLYSDAVELGYAYTKHLSSSTDQNLQELANAHLPYFSEEKEKIEHTRRTELAEDGMSKDTQ